nr:MAG TPA: hypothetical protein [Bacteriophage sp.]
MKNSANEKKNTRRADQSNGECSTHQRFPIWINLFYHRGDLQARINLEVTMENKRILLEQIERLLAMASETQLRILYIAALHLV